MKIFLSFLQGKPDHPIPAYSFWGYYIKNGIEEAGHTWIEAPKVDWAEGLVPKSNAELASWKANIWQKTVDFLKENPVDLFLSYLYPHQIDEVAIAEIKKLGIPCVNFFCDNVREFNAAPKEFGVFDLNWVPEFKALKFYEKAKMAHLNLPMPMWVSPKDRILATKETERITFIGSHDLQRQLLFEALVKLEPNLPLDIYGANWRSDTQQQQAVITPNYGMIEKLKFQLEFLTTQGFNAYVRKIQQRKNNAGSSKILLQQLMGKPDFETYVGLTKESMVTLGVNRYPSFRHPLNSPDTYSRLRDIEAPMLGACYLTEWTAGLENMYDLGSEVETYGSAEELIEKVTCLSKDKTLRSKMRINAQKKALEMHSIENTLLFLKNKLAIK